MKLAFAGTPEFARVALEALHRAGFEVALVLTQPDRPAGRGMKLQPSPVKAFAASLGVEVLQPRGLKLDGRHAEDAADARARLDAAAPDAMVVAAYGLILPAWTLALPRLGCLNIHASLLPRWRGAAPIHRAIEAGDTTTGITVMQMDAGLDTGSMLLHETTPIAADDTTARLHDRLAALGGRLVVEALHLAEQGRLAPVVQPADGITYAHKIDKSEAAVDWSQSAVALERRLRAFDPFPGLTGMLDGEPVKFWRAAVTSDVGPPGEVIAVDADGLTVACGRGALRLQELQRAGGRRMPAAAFLQARPLRIGQRFDAPPTDTSANG